MPAMIISPKLSVHLPVSHRPEAGARRTSAPALPAMLAPHPASIGSAFARRATGVSAHAQPAAYFDDVAQRKRDRVQGHVDLLQAQLDSLTPQHEPMLQSLQKLATSNPHAAGTLDADALAHRAQVVCDSVDHVLAKVSNPAQRARLSALRKAHAPWAQGRADDLSAEEDAPEGLRPGGELPDGLAPWALRV